MVKPFLYRHPLPFPRRPGAPAVPNVIVLFLESFSVDLLEPYGGPIPGLTPHLVDISRVSMRVDDYFNHTAPTIKGLRGQLCSAFPLYQHREWKQAKEKLRDARVLCLPHLLKQRDYRSVYLSHASPDEAYLQSQMIDWGFDETYFRDTITDEFLGGEPFARFRQPTDRQMFRSLIAYLERWDAARPLFLCLSTVETHTAWDVGEDGVPFGDASNRVLNTFHNLDAVIGLFWEWFRQSPFFDNTILVITGDHVIYPHEAMRQVAGPAYVSSNLGRMGLFIYDPTHDLPPVFAARTSSIDLAPSLLQLLHFEDQPNAFMGHSMFSDRGDFLGGFGESGTDEILYWESGQPDTVAARSLCDDPRAAATRHPCAVLRIVEYLQGLDRTNRIWRH